MNVAEGYARTMERIDRLVGRTEMTRKQAFEASFRKVVEVINAGHDEDGCAAVLTLFRAVHDASTGGCTWREIEEVLRRIDAEEDE